MRENARGVIITSLLDSVQIMPQSTSIVPQSANLRPLPRTSSGQKIAKVDIRRSILNDGVLYKVSSDDVSNMLIERVWPIIQLHFGRDARFAHEQMSQAKFLAAITNAKRDVFKDQMLRELTVKICRRYLFNQTSGIFEPLRLRVVPPSAPPIKQANQSDLPPLYKPHRDTWFANHPSQINTWIALHDVGPDDSFTLFPDCFDRAIQNNSGEFDFEDWSKTVGFGNSHTNPNALYPSPTAPGERFDRSHDAARSFALDKGEMLVFAASHLHATNQHQQSQTRFSLDFRAVDVTDLQNDVVAPQIDNASKGSASDGYLSMRNFGKNQ
ncbi:MAG: hypothetical protein QG625_3286 [Cyanobacteriota bacterium erpe_2018_sw_39hr_WHONDRS-SW48-000098_B_bin.30]|nr:hypothetical protein [Cyanobacteriota bacterium erpe_2018_sw_39hr_WHONDRS-SW48-000098_B_bin.30]